jgi:hypothetical protein
MLEKFECRLPIKLKRSTNNIPVKISRSLMHESQASQPVHPSKLFWQTIHGTI